MTGDGNDPADRSRAAFRAFVREYHPDRGGDVATFIAGLAEFRAERVTTAAENQRAVSRYDAPVVVVVRPRGVRAIVTRLRRWWDRRIRKTRVR